MHRLLAPVGLAMDARVVLCGSISEYTRDEPFGLTTLEGMACGLATLAGNHGGSPEVLGDAGVLFEKDSAQDLADKLQPLVSDAAHRRVVAKRCRERAESMTWQNTWQQLDRLLHANTKDNSSAA